MKLQSDHESVLADPVGDRQITRVALLCAGLDRVNRGYETHVRLVFEGIRASPAGSTHVILFKGDGLRSAHEVVLPTPKRDGALCRLLGRFRGDALYWEYLLFALGFLVRAALCRERFDTVSCIEPMVAKTVFRFRRWLPGQPRITFTHGVWMEPRQYEHFGDSIHEVNVENYERMRAHLEATGSDTELVCIPHFVQADDGRKDQPTPSRLSLGILTRYVVVTVGVIDSDHKRTDHVIREVAKLGTEWTLLACGTPKGADGERVAALGRELLASRFVQISLPRNEVWKAYAVADFFVLGSLNEGFGLVILEAMRAGLPVFAHDRPLFRWILKTSGCCVPMDIPGKLSTALRELSARPDQIADMSQSSRREFQRRFTWEMVRSDYVRLLTGRSDSSGRGDMISTDRPPR